MIASKEGTTKGLIIYRYKTGVKKKSKVIFRFMKLIPSPFLPTMPLVRPEKSFTFPYDMYESIKTFFKWARVGMAFVKGI